MGTTFRNRSRQPRTLLAVASIALVFVLGVGALLWRGAVASVLWRVITPLAHIRDRVNYSENERLRTALASTSALVADREALYQENIDLKSRLNRPAPLERVLAGVLMRPPQVPYDTLLLDVGSAHGISQGDVVSAGGTTAIGTIIEVHTTTSRAQLLSAPGLTYDALLMVRGAASSSAAEVPLQLVGQGAGSLTAQVPAGTRVLVGQNVTLPGVFGGYVGVVSSVASHEGESFKTLYLHLPVDLFSLKYVEIWKHAQ